MKLGGCSQGIHLPFPQPELFFLCLCAIRLSEGKLHSEDLPVEIQEISVLQCVRCCTDIVLHLSVGQSLSVLEKWLVIQFVPFNVYRFLEGFLL